MAIGGADGSVSIVDVVADAVVARLQNFKSDVQSLQWARLPGAACAEAPRSFPSQAGDMPSFLQGLGHMCYSVCEWAATAQKLRNAWCSGCQPHTPLPELSTGKQRIALIMHY